MGRPLDLIGNKYNKLTVIEKTSKRDSSGCIIWKCQCECGATTEASSNALRTNHKRSCGCLNKEQVKELGHSNLIDLTGQVFGKLTVISKADKTDASRRVYWNCLCDCGNNYIANGHSLKNGNLQSCGCIKSRGEQKISELLTQHNISFEKEKIFKDFKPYRYDFYVQNKYIIEYDGKQHYQDTVWGEDITTFKEAQAKDNVKNQYCHNNNIPIIRIPYFHFNELCIEDLLLESSTFILER